METKHLIVVVALMLGLAGVGYAFFLLWVPKRQAAMRNLMGGGDARAMGGKPWGILRRSPRIACTRWIC